jgi:hypothetical protein
MTKIVMGIGVAGIVACVTWWAIFYTKVLDLMGATMKPEDWQRGVALFSDCMFWDRPQCVAVKAATNLAGYVPYQPLFLWLSAGVLLAGILLKINDAWHSK